VCDQMVRELPDREDVDEVEQQLQRGDIALGARLPRDSHPHGRDPTGAIALDAEAVGGPATARPIAEARRAIGRNGRSVGRLRYG
jgi:hypothetical protein